VLLLDVDVALLDDELLLDDAAALVDDSLASFSTAAEEIVVVVLGVTLLDELLESADSKLLCVSLPVFALSS
jgi:hypothetical protein